MMKKCFFFTLLSVCLLGFVNQADAQSKAECFKMQTGRAVKEIPVEKTFTAERSNNELKLFDGIDAVYGLSVTMDIQRLAENYLVRVVLIDKEGHKHLVAESYREIAPEEKNLQLTDYCEETALLDGVNPVSLQVITDNAEVALHSLSIATEGSREQTPRSEEFRKQTASLRRQQVEEKVSQINIYNKAHKKLWVAGPTSVSLMGYEDKTKMMNATAETNFGGFEYYAGGIFEIGDAAEARKEQSPSRQASSPTALTSVNTAIPLTSFDWRNRHGKNWMTGVRDQGQTPYCVAFALAGCIESMVNLYYNNPSVVSELDLSEQQIACCSFTNNSPSILQSVPFNDAVSYCQNNGVYLESDYGFNENAPQICQSDGITPSERIKITGVNDVSSNSLESIKRALIEKGPLYTTIAFMHYDLYHQFVKWSHAMLLTGFGQIYEGMNIVDLPNTNTNPLGVNETIEHGDSRIGETFLIYKNSWGTDFGNQGYAYIFFSGTTLNLPNSIATPITTLHYSENDRICSDNDGDGYYFWGGDTPPPSLPSWAPAQKDVDDTDPAVGRLLDYGVQVEDIVPDHRPIVSMNGNLMASDSFHFPYIHFHSTLQSGATLNVNSRLNFYNGAIMTLCSGSTLVIREGGFMNNAILNIESGSRIIVEGGGRIKLAQGYCFEAPVGAIVEIENGSIEPFSE